MPFYGWCEDSAGKLTLPSGFDRYVPEQMAVNGFTQLAIGFHHVATSGRLPWHHRDPFDRLLIAQAIEEDIPVISRDTTFGKYQINRIW